MPPINRYTESIIPKLYKRQIFDVMLFSFVEAFRIAQPTVTVVEAVGAFLKHYNIDPALYDLRVALTTYNRINKELIDAQRTKGPQDNG